jgi:hypothetical protein
MLDLASAAAQPLQIGPVQVSFLKWLVEEELARRENYDQYREYYDGVHDAQLTDRQRKFLELRANQEFRVNYCPIVVDALAERLNVTGFDAGAQGADLWAWWKANRMDAVQQTVHLSAVRDGDAYVMVDWDNKRSLPRFALELALSQKDGGCGVKVTYGDNRQPAFASKRWRERQEGGGLRARLNLYYPDRIEKYGSQIGASSQWQQQREADEEWPIRWTDRAGEPLGIPVIHFRNKDTGYNYGTSELADVLPIQNAFNKAMLDLIAAADTTAFRIFYMIGDDPSGLKVAPGSWVYSTKPSSGEGSVDIGQFPGEDLTPLIKLKDSTAMEVARVTRTPISFFQLSGDRPAEGTLKQEESGLVAKTKNRQVTFGNAWEDVMAMARRLANAFGGANLPDEGLSTQWADIEIRNEKEHMETLELKLKLGIPKKRLWGEAGYDEATIEKMLLEAADEEQAQAELGDRLLAAFERGPQARRTMIGPAGNPAGQTPPAGGADNVIGGQEGQGQEGQQQQVAPAKGG